MTPLEKTIVRWQQNATASDPDHASTNLADCALCVEHYDTDMDLLEAQPLIGPSPCEGCPVYAHTGKSGCRGTPFVLADRELEEWEYDPSYKDAFQAAARAEVKFLEGLLLR